MEKIGLRKRLKHLIISLRLGFFLALRQIRRSSKWTTLLIIFVMTLTFLNLVVVSGILVGLIEGSVVAIKSRYLSDVIVSTLDQKSYVENSPYVVNVARNLPWTQAISARYLEVGTLEADYKNRIKDTDKIDSVSAIVAGINIEDEHAVTGIKDLIVEGSFLEQSDFDQVLLGHNLLDKYLPIESPGFDTLKDVEIGDKVRLKINGNVREVYVKGILKSKVDEISRRIFMTDTQLRGLIGRSDYNVDEISILTKPGVGPEVTRDALLASEVGKYAKVQTFEEGLPKFLIDIKNTFALLGNMVSSIGLVVASITIFIVIFINAITRRKFIGILKGIGIHSTAIEFAYVIQSLFYAIMGTAIGAIILYGLLIPFIDKHPINFPFSDGILVATVSGTLIRFGILLVATLIAGYIPAKIVVKQNTLDAILGR